MKRRILSIIMAMAMTLSLMAVPAFAANGDETGGSAAQAETAITAENTTLESGNYYLSGDTVLSNGLTVPSGVTATIDLRGHTLSSSAGHTITNQGSLTITDSGTKGSLQGNNAGYSALQNEPGATAVIEGGTISKSNNESSSGLLCHYKPWYFDDQWRYDYEPKLPQHAI